jgi:hypothetical protein
MKYAVDRTVGAIISSPKLKFYTPRVAVAVGVRSDGPFLTKEHGYINPPGILYEKMVAQFIWRILEDQPRGKRKILEGALDALG